MVCSYISRTWIRWPSTTWRFSVGPNTGVLEKLERDDWTRRDLRDETGISQPTLGRILDGFEERGWATEHRTENGRE
jgi:hypothetical protein